MLNDLTNEKSFTKKMLLDISSGANILLHGQDRYSRQEALSAVIQTYADEGVLSLTVAASSDFATVLNSQDNSLDKRIYPWDISAEQGIPFRTTVSRLGPLHLSRILELNAVQEGVLRICFRLEREEDYVLLDLDDLQALLSYMNRHPDELGGHYGSISTASVAAIIRRIIRFQDEYGNELFGEPALDIRDLLTMLNGQSLMHLLFLDQILKSNLVVSTFILFVLEQLNDALPKRGIEMPQYVIAFDQVERIFLRADIAFLDRFTALMDELNAKGVNLIFLASKADSIPKLVLERIFHQVDVTVKVKPKHMKNLMFDEQHEFFRKYKRRSDISSAKEKLAAQALSSKAAGTTSSKTKPSSALKKMTDAAAATIGREIGRNLVRGIIDKLKRS